MIAYVLFCRMFRSERARSTSCAFNLSSLQANCSAEIALANVPCARPCAVPSGTVSGSVSTSEGKFATAEPDTASRYAFMIAYALFCRMFRSERARSTSCAFDRSSL